jgi:hypothetical protein
MLRIDLSNEFDIRLLLGLEIGCIRMTAESSAWEYPDAIRFIHIGLYGQ